VSDNVALAYLFTGIYLLWQVNVKFCYDKLYHLLIHEATTPFEIGGNFKPDENSVLIAAVPDTKTGINQTLTVPNPDFVRSHRKYRDRYVVIVIINKY
jgi:hypothetical protein